MIDREQRPMSAADSHHQDGAATRPRPTAVGRIARRVWRLIVLATFALAVGFVAGFLWFVASVPTEEISIDRPADGIAVFTGGGSRITDAIELLAAGRGKRPQKLAGRSERQTPELQ